MYMSNIYLMHVSVLKFVIQGERFNCFYFALMYVCNCDRWKCGYNNLI